MYVYLVYMVTCSIVLIFKLKVVEVSNLVYIYFMVIELF